MQKVYTLVITQTLSLIGSQMTSVAVGIWVFAETGAAAPILLTMFFNELPGMLAGSLAGVWIDRWNRKTAIALSDAGQAIGSLLLLASLASGQFALWHLYAVALLQGAFAIFQGPARSAVITQLAPPEQRQRANGIQEIAFPLAGVAAPVFAGTLYSIMGVIGVIVIDLLTFLAASGVVLLMKIPKAEPTEAGLAAQGSALQELRGGIRFILQRKPLLLFIVYLVFINFMLNGPLGLAVPYLMTLTGDEQQAGLLLGVMSLGAFAGATLITLWKGTPRRVDTILGGLSISGVMFIFFGLAQSAALLGASLFMVLLPLPVMNAMVVTIFQAKTPADLQGRVFSAFEQLGYLGSTSSFFLTGLLVDRVIDPAAAGRWLAPWLACRGTLAGCAGGANFRMVLVATGGIILLATILAYAQPAIRKIEALLPDWDG